MVLANVTNAVRLSPRLMMDRGTVMQQAQRWRQLKLQRDKFTSVTHDRSSLWCQRHECFQGVWRCQQRRRSPSFYPNVVSAPLTTTTTTNSSNNDDRLIYESPLGRVVHKLRSVSLLTAVCGSLGLPLVLAIKGGNMPDTGLLVMSLTFCSGTIASTAAVHVVFAPYVYAMYEIPVRQCHAQNVVVASNNNSGQHGRPENDGQPGRSDAPATASTPTTLPPPPQHQHNERRRPATMLKAVTRNLWLQQRDVIFDVHHDKVVKYKGWRPMCNLWVHDGVALYVHTEFLYHEGLRAILVDDKDRSQKLPQDDDFF